MNGIRIKDMHPKGFLLFDLKDILSVVKTEVADSKWSCRDVEATTLRSPHVEEYCKNSDLISCKLLMEAAENTRQVVDGIFSASFNDSEWLRIEAIDSTYWEVFSKSSEVLSKLKEQFNDVECISS